MRPRYLEIEGLQSFKEPQSINFDILGETGLFGIFGPTGSGKSTILDAVTLALYGNVQRANRGTQGIINMSAVSMRVSFTFDLVKANQRKTYRVERVYRRKKDSENSIESRITRLLEQTASGDLVIADKQGEVNEAVIELIGLQFDDFTRSVVLPQNKFQEFLLSPKAEKTKMLERIFYLEEYGRELMDTVNRKLGHIRNKLSGIEGALSVLGDISETSLKEVEASLKSSAEHKKSVDASLKASEAEYSSAKEVWELSKELSEALHKQEELMSMSAQIEILRACCTRAIAAESLSERISDLKKTDVELTKTIEKLKGLEESIIESGVLLEKGKKELDKASELREERIPLLIEYKTKLTKALQTKGELEKIQETLQKLRNEYLEFKKKVDGQEEIIKTQKVKLEEALEKAAKLKTYVESLKVEAGYRDKIQKGSALEEELENSEKIVEQQRKRYEELLSIINQQEKELGVLEKSGISIYKEIESVKVIYDQHKQIKKWDRNDILKAETRYYSIKSITDALKLKCKDIEELELKLNQYDKQLEELGQRNSRLIKEQESKQRELDRSKLELEEKKNEQERNTAFLISQTLRDNEPCPVCGAKEHPKPAARLEEADTAAGAELIKTLQAMTEKLAIEFRTLENEGIKLSEQHNNLRAHKAALRLDMTKRQEEQSELLGKLPEDYQELSITLIEGTLDKMSGEKQERLKAIEGWEKELSELEAKQKKAEVDYNNYQVESSGKGSQLKANKGHLVEMEKSYKEAQGVCNEKKELYYGFVKALGIENMRSELKRLQSNDHEAERRYSELQTIEKSIDELRAGMEKTEEARSIDLERLSESTAEGRGLKYQKEEKEKELQAILGDNDINIELVKAEEEIAALAKVEQKAQEYVNVIRERHETALKDKKVLEKQKEIYGEKSGKETERLSERLKEKGFVSIAAVEEALMHKDKLDEQERTVKEYEEHVNSTKANKELIEKKLSGRAITEQQWQEISSRYEELKLLKENSIAAYEGAKNRFETIKGNYESWLSLGKELQGHSKKREHLELFKSLLKGNGFIEYISEERLRYIAKEASGLLSTLTRHRYGLELDTENGFVIRDDANGGMRRLVTSLSGGETFLTSLALALALSSQIQLKGQSPLEFFFLDEGFGTLDSSLLDTVIDALERLSSEKRVIGLISHVPEMKSRITRRLVVEAPIINSTGSRVFMEKA